MENFTFCAVCVILLRGTKKTYLTNININSVTDNKKF